MGNPLLGNAKIPKNPIQNIMQLRNQMRQLKQNPQGVADFLKQSGQITDEQYKDIRGMNGNFSQVGQYLLNAAPQNMYGQIERGVNNVQNQIKEEA